MTTFYDLVPAAAPGRFDGIERNYTPEEVIKLRGVCADQPHAGRARRCAPLAAFEQRALHQRAGCPVRQSGHANGARGSQSNLSFRLAGGR